MAFWEKRWHHKFILNLTDLYVLTRTYFDKKKSQSLSSKLQTKDQRLQSKQKYLCMQNATNKECMFIVQFCLLTTAKWKLIAHFFTKELFLLQLYFFLSPLKVLNASSLSPIMQIELTRRWMNALQKFHITLHNVLNL